MSFLTPCGMGSAQCHDGGAPTAGVGGGIAKSGYERRPRQHRADDFALHPDSPPMNDAEGFESGRPRFQQIFLHDALDIAGRHTVQIENVRDGDSYRFGLGIGAH